MPRALWTLAALAVFAPALAAAERPNILLCIADDWGFPHAGCYGDPVARTPNFDKFAASGVLFSNSFCVSPSCTPSRAALLTGQTIHRLGEGANLWGILPKRFDVYPDLLEQAGYVVGVTGKGWGPGSLEGSGRTRNPAGTPARSFSEFLKSVPADKPFCFWQGSRHPHRPYPPGSGAAAGFKAEAVRVPPYLPDTPEVRSDLLDHYLAVQKFDEELGATLKALDESGRSANTLVIVTSDNGLPFPRAKANLYDAGTHLPLAIRWPKQIAPGRLDALVSHCDIAPTILDTAGLKPRDAMTGRNLMPLLLGAEKNWVQQVYLERERHANVRKGDLTYPCRAVRTAKFLYLRNLAPDRWPAGDPETHHSVGPFGDCDPGPSKEYILRRREEAKVRPFFALCFDKRPAEELYDLTADPHQLVNVAGRPQYTAVQAEFRQTLTDWQRTTGDPRSGTAGDQFDSFRYFGGPARPGN